MQKTATLTLTLELLFWLVTALIVGGVLYPIYRVAPDYPFLLRNVLFIVLAVTTTRYIFLLKHTWLAYLTWIKVFFIFAAIPLIFFLIDGINDFQTYLDENTFDSFLGHLKLERRETMTRYIRSEMIFFGTAAVIGTAAFALRMVLSLWRNRNRGTV